jgi:Tfp pilus assembly PilM family ATPase/Tfp pilus assembly protein PilN
MPQTVLGLDIGQSTIKAVLFTRKGLTGGRILAAETIDINACGGMEPALKKLAESKSFHNTPCCISLPLVDIMFRQVSLPFRDDNKIRKTLPFELEPLIPFAVSEIVIDYLKVHTSGLLVAAATKKVIQNWISLVESNLGEVSVIDISAAALTSAILEKKDAGASGVLLDIGAGSTAAVFYENGTIVQLRSLAMGGNQITVALAADMSLETREAELTKINAAYSAVGAKVSDLCHKFCLELKNTIEFMKLNDILQSNLTQITITGGGCLFPPLKKEVENYFALPVETLDLARSKQIEIEGNLQGKYQPQIMNTALAAAMRIFNGKTSFNFRQGEFAAKNVRIKLREQLKWAAVVAGIIFFLAAVNQFLDYGMQAQRQNNIKKQISLIFKKNFPEAQTMVDPVQQLKTKLAENKKTFGLYEGARDITVVDLLKEISGLISTSRDIVITDFSYENTAVLIKGQAKNIDDVSAIKNELAQSRYFKDVVMGSTSLTKQGTKVDFDLRIELR